MPAQYTTGTVTVAYGSQIVTGEGTSWTGQINVGDMLLIDPAGPVGIVASVQSNTSLTLEAPWSGTDATGAAYAIHRDFDPVTGAPLAVMGQKYIHHTINGAVRALGDISNRLIRINAASTPRTLADRALDMLSVRDFGAVGDGSADDTVAIENAIYAAVNDGQRAVYFPRGVYRVTRQLNIINSQYVLIGERNERGTNTIEQIGNDYHAVRIVFDSPNPAQSLISVWADGLPLGASFGPFIHQNICFDLRAGGSGIEIGRVGADGVISDSGGEPYMFRPVFEGCAFHGKRSDFDSTDTGVMTRSGQFLIRCVKAFEAVVDDCSFVNGDIHLDFIGCDTPTITRCRAVGAHVGIRMQGSGTFTAQGRIQHYQNEGWSLAAIEIAGGMACNISATRLEMNASFKGQGRFSIPATAVVSAGSKELIFSSSMEGVLFPGLSILEITDGVNIDHVLVESVNGNHVYVVTDDLFRFTWSASAATVTRIHGYGMILNGREVTVSGVSPGAAENTPWLVWVANEEIAVNNCLAVPGSYGDIRALIIGNRHGAQGKGLHRRAVFSGVSPLLLPDPRHPFVHAVGATDTYDPNYRAPVTFPYYKGAVPRWWLGPDNSATSNDGSNEIVFRRIVEGGQPWYAYALPAGGSVLLPITGLSRDAGKWYRLLVSVKGSGPNGQIGVVAGSPGAGFSLGSRRLRGGLQVLTFLFRAPPPWRSMGTGQAFLQVSAIGDDCDLIGCELIDETDLPQLGYASSAFLTTTARRLAVTPSVATEIFRIENPVNTDAMVARLDLSIANTSSDVGFAVARRTYEVAFSAYAGSPVVLGVLSLTNTGHSMNPAVISVDVIVTAIVDNGDISIMVTGTVTGTEAGRQTLAVTGEMHILGPENVLVSM